MRKSDFDALKAKAREITEKSTDMDTLIAAIMKLPYGQLKKVLSDEVMAVLEKYGYTQ
jgi:hypothetical protein